MNPFLAELPGTMLLVRFGDGGVANVVLSRSKGQNSGWNVIAAGRAAHARVHRRADRRRGARQRARVADLFRTGRSPRTTGLVQNQVLCREHAQQPNDDRPVGPIIGGVAGAWVCVALWTA